MSDDDKKESEHNGLYMGLAMAAGIAVLMLIGYLFRGSATL